LPKAPVKMRAEQTTPAPAQDGSQIVSTHLRHSTRNSESGSDQDAGALEIVAYRTPRKAK
jgi:hypothetical protein